MIRCELREPETPSSLTEPISEAPTPAPDDAAVAVTITPMPMAAAAATTPSRPRRKDHGRCSFPPPPKISPPEEEDEVTCGRATASCALSGFGWCFDVGTALVSVADVVSDFMVAAQFASEGLWVWFGLVIASLFISNCVFTVWFNEFATMSPPFRPLEGITRLIRYPVAFFAAQLLPTAVWAGHVAVRCGFFAGQSDKVTMNGYFMRPGQCRLINEHKTWNDDTHAAAAVREEMAAAAASSLLLGRLEAALSQHMKAHSMFYIETVIEAIPQSVIQLLAMTFLGRASGVQIVSTVLSLLTISSKAYVVSRSCDVRMFLFKFALAVHDVFCLFYVFSTLLSRDGSLDWDLFGTGVELSTMSCVWIIRLFAVVGVILLIAATVALVGVVGNIIYRLATRGCPRCPSRYDLPDAFRVFIAIVIFLGIVLVSVPVILFLDAMKFGWLIVLDLNQQPSVNTYPALSAALAFLRNGDYDERARHIIGFSARNQYRRFTPERQGYFRYVDGDGPPQATISSLDTYAAWARDGKTTALDFKLRRPDDPSGRWSVCPRRGPQRCEEFFIIAIMSTLIGTYAIGQVFGAVFPFVNMAVEGWDGQNHIQLVCFVLDAAALLVALVLLPSAWDYVKLMALRTASLGFPSSWERDEATMLRCIEEYVVPPHHTVLWAVVPAEVVPALVTVNVVAPFATARDVGLHRLSGRKCRAYADGFDATFAIGQNLFVCDEVTEETVADDGEKHTIKWVPASAALQELDACGPLRPPQRPPSPKPPPLSSDSSDD